MFQGRPFVDRDGAMFTFVLDFLRTGEFSSGSIDLQDRVMVRRLEKEAKYYRLPAMVEHIYDRLHPWRHNFDGGTPGRYLRGGASPAQGSVYLAHMTSSVSTLRPEGSCVQGEHSGTATPHAEEKLSHKLTLGELAILYCSLWLILWAQNATGTLGCSVLQNPL